MALDEPDLRPASPRADDAPANPARARPARRSTSSAPRALPAGNQRYVVVNTAAQRLFMYENGQVVDSMRVVVGKPKHATPMMNAFIRAAALNPYWNVPPDLAAERIAPNVVKQGVGYLKSHGLSAAVGLERQSDSHRSEPRSTGRRSPTAASKCASASCRDRTTRSAR